MGSSNSADQAWAFSSGWFWAWEVLDMGRAIIWRFRHRQPGCRNAKSAHFIDPPRVTGYSPGPRARGAGAPGSRAPPGADAGIRRLPYRRRAAGRVVRGTGHWGGCQVRSPQPGAVADQPGAADRRRATRHAGVADRRL